MFRINSDCDGFFIRTKSNGANINQRICEKLDISIRKFNSLVRKNNGIVEKTCEWGKRFIHTHRFKEIKDCENFLKELEPYIVMEKLIK